MNYRYTVDNILTAYTIAGYGVHVSPCTPKIYQENGNFNVIIFLYNQRQCSMAESLAGSHLLSSEELG